MTRLVSGGGVGAGGIGGGGIGDGWYSVWALYVLSYTGMWGKMGSGIRILGLLECDVGS